MSLLSIVRVRDAMHSVTKVRSSTTVAEAAVIMDSKQIGSVLIEENGKIAGIMTERDILRKVVAKGRDPKMLTVKDMMSQPLITIDSDATLDVASKIMEQHGIRRLVVIEKGTIVGIITTRDVSNNINYLLAKGAMSYLPEI
ncbi:CBS domain-containing protein [archaeon]|nr:MAG: CBS domain-containing protein [archaeon]